MNENKTILKKILKIIKKQLEEDYRNEHLEDDNDFWNKLEEQLIKLLKNK